MRALAAVREVGERVRTGSTHGSGGAGRAAKAAVLERALSLHPYMFVQALTLPVQNPDPQHAR